MNRLLRLALLSLPIVVGGCTDDTTTSTTDTGATTDTGTAATDTGSTATDTGGYAIEPLYGVTVTK